MQRRWRIKGLKMATAIIDNLFEVIVDASGSLSAEESYMHRCLLGTIMHPFILEKEGAPRWISRRKFCCRHSKM